MSLMIQARTYYEWEIRFSSKTTCKLLDVSPNVQDTPLKINLTLFSRCSPLLVSLVHGLPWPWMPAAQCLFRLLTIQYLTVSRLLVFICISCIMWDDSIVICGGYKHSRGETASIQPATNTTFQFLQWAESSYIVSGLLYRIFAIWRF